MYITDYIKKGTKLNGERYMLDMLNGNSVTDTEEYFDALQAVMEDGSAELTKEQEEYFHQNKFLFEDRQEQEDYVAQLVQREVERDNSITFFLHMTYCCNLSCTYCNYKDMKRESKQMSVEDIEKAFQSIEGILSTSKAKKITFVLFGGEPFLVSNIHCISRFFQLYRKLKAKEASNKREFTLIAFSNGTNAKRFEMLFVNQLEHINGIYVTLNANKKLHDSKRIYGNGEGSFLQTLEGIHFLLEKKVPVWLVVNVDKDTIHSLPDMQKLIEENNWKENPYYLGCCVSRIKNRFGDYEKFLYEHELIDEVVRMVQEEKIDITYFNFEDMRILKNIINFIDSPEDEKRVAVSGCGNRLHQYSFTPDGMIYPCSPAAGDSKYSIGSYRACNRRHSVKDEYWTSNGSEGLEKCEKCSMKLLCGGGCPLERKVKNMDEVCPKADAVFDSYIRAAELGINIVDREIVYEQ